MDYLPSFIQSYYYYFQSFTISILALFFCFMIIKTLINHFIVKTKKPKLPPGPKIWPIVGNIPEILANKPVDTQNDGRIKYRGKGKEDGGPGIEEVEHINAVFMLLKYTYAFSISDYIPRLRWLDLDGHKSMIEKAMRTMNQYHDSIIEERIKLWNEGSKMDEEDLLDVFILLKDLNNNPLLTVKEIKAQIIELMMAMVDNPSNAVEWIPGELIKQPMLLQQVTEELDTVIGKDRLVQESDIPKLNLVKACVREAFRLHPIVAFNVPHVPMNDTIVGNYLIPKGSHVLLSRRGLGRNLKVWSKPYEFKPERHLKNNGLNIDLTEPNLNFISFSSGRRSCPGVMLGTTMTIMLLARLLHGFSWCAPPNVSNINLVESENDMFLVEPLVRGSSKCKVSTRVVRILN